MPQPLFIGKKARVRMSIDEALHMDDVMAPTEVPLYDVFWLTTNIDGSSYKDPLRAFLKGDIGPSKGFLGLSWEHSRA